MREERKARLSRLLAPVGITGAETDIAEVIRKEIEGFVDEISIDALGNLVAIKRNPGAKKMIICAHMDRIGLMITTIDDNGFLRVAPVGGQYPRNLMGTQVCFTNGVMGSIGYETSHGGEIDLVNLFIDIGAASKEEAEKRVAIGDVAMVCSVFADLGQRVAQGGMDNRAGCGVLVEALQALKNSAYEIVAVFTVQEEIGIRGATTASYAADPDYGLALDVTPTYDTPKAVKMNGVALGKGAAIKIFDRGVVCHPTVKRWLADTAEAEGIPYQYEVLTGGATDAMAIHLTRGGVPTGVISVPCRYVHSQSEMIDMGDYEASIDLLVKALERKIDS